jgi:hypothetical protein
MDFRSSMELQNAYACYWRAESNSKFYIVIVIPMLYGSECWSSTESKIGRMETTERHLLGVVLG